MQSAEEFAKHIEWCLLTSSDFRRSNYLCAAKSIRARDKEISDRAEARVTALEEALYKVNASKEWDYLEDSVQEAVTSVLP